MAAVRLGSVAFILALASLAWCALGTATAVRTRNLDQSLSVEMSSLWGPRVLAQPSPWWGRSTGASREDEDSAGPAASGITADLTHEHRYKGLLWYSTFTVDFSATYRFEPTGQPEGSFFFPLPEGVRTYQDVRTEVDGVLQTVSPGDIAQGLLVIPLDRTAERVVTVRYRAGGRDAWLYCAGEAPVVSFADGYPVVAADGPLQEARDLDLTVTTNFTEIDYPRGSLSPAERARPGGEGMRASWKFPRLISSQAIGIVMPNRPNAGPIAARMSFFAPVSLLFFFTVLLMLVVLKKIPLHPMHYLFVAAGFFSFHILLAYLADLVPIQIAFWICAAVSVFLVVSYMRLVAGVRLAVTWIALAQAVYLVGFSYAFFWEGRTGLTIVIGAIGTLFLLMQTTGRVDWFEVLRPAVKKKTIEPIPGPVIET